MTENERKSLEGTRSRMIDKRLKMKYRIMRYPSIYYYLNRR